MSTQEITQASVVVPAAAFEPREKIPLLTKPFNWTVNKMRTVEQLGAHWKALEAKNPDVTWKTLAKDIGNIILGVLAALVLTVFTLGIGGALLIREYGKQKENEAYLQCKQTYKKKLAAVATTETTRAEQAEMEYQVAYKALEKEKREQEKNYNDLNKKFTSTIEQNKSLVTNCKKLQNENAEINKHNANWKNHVDQYIQDLTRIAQFIEIINEEDKTPTISFVNQALTDKISGFKPGTRYYPGESTHMANLIINHLEAVVVSEEEEVDDV